MILGASTLITLSNLAKVDLNIIHFRGNIEVLVLKTIDVREHKSMLISFDSRNYTMMIDFNTFKFFVYFKVIP
jgi:hypothetical protein